MTNLLTNPSNLLTSNSVEDFSKKLAEMKEENMLLNINLVRMNKGLATLVDIEYTVGRKTYHHHETNSRKIKEVYNILEGSDDDTTH